MDQMKWCIKIKKTSTFLTPTRMSHPGQHFSMFRAKRRPVLFSRRMTPLWGRGCVTWTQWSLPDVYKKIKKKSLHSPQGVWCIQAVWPTCSLKQKPMRPPPAWRCISKFSIYFRWVFHNVLGENVMFSVWGPHGGDYNRYLFGAQELTTRSGNVFSDNTQYSQQIPDLDKHLSLYLASVCFSFK